ncbi:hypothetical protein [Gimesia aquarii]|nr:hypothetical protein [Gimesia aquarii]
MRWYIVAGIISALFGFFGVACGLLMLGTMAYYNTLYGPIEFSNGEYEGLDNIALVWQNVLQGCLVLLAGIGACIAANCWFKQKNRRGVIVFVVSILLSAIASLILRP